MKLTYSSLSASGVLGLLQKLKLREFVCCDSCLKPRQSRMVWEKKGALQEADSLLYVTRLASCFSCHDNCWHSSAALSIERWNTYLEGVYSLSCGQDAEAQVVLHC